MAAVPDAKKLESLKEVANRLRIDSIKATNAGGSGHPTSCCSAAEVMAVLFFHEMKYSVKAPRDAANDRFILSKGHAAPVLYAAWAEAGLFPVEDLLKLRKIDNDLEGHPTPRLNFIDVATGSLGQGLSIAAGMAYTGKYFDKAEYRTYCLIGDGESAEGSIWEAMNFASHYKLDNLVAIFDVNRLGQSDPAMLEHDTETYRKRAEAFGWNTYVVDGHDVEALCKAFYDATTVKNKPTCIVAKTLKGKGIPGIEDLMGWHGKPLGDKAAAAIEAIQSNIKSTNGHGLCPALPTSEVKPIEMSVKLAEPPNYNKGDKVATRVAYGTALVKLGKDNPRVIAMDGDTKNSTFSDTYRKAFPDRYVECYIAEQNLCGIAMGAACRDRAIVFASTFAAFWTRCFDHIRMGAVSQTNVNFCGSHCGISIGEDGPSQMALEDIAMFRTIPTATVFYPCEAVSAERAIELAANTKGICFIRTSRPATPVLYSNDEPFQAGKAKIVHDAENPQVTVVGAGVTVHEAITAAEKLAAEGINIRVIDPFTIKPMDAETLAESARKTGGKVITVEDHYPEGGVGEAVAGALSTLPNVTVRRLAVTGVPRSGKPAELLEMFGINANAVIKAVKEMI
ncbi:transketolase-like isoform X2 [Ptychodera flava]|uniref:transketolase-like isoform X2 n=1 Tax=Ptychodera flava TaxID=63121 RepID=UPI003969F1A9